MAGETGAVGYPRPLWQIAGDIQKDWAKVDNKAVKWLSAMSTLNSIEDDYGINGAESVVRLFLTNANTWKGSQANRIKQELREWLKLI